MKLACVMVVIALVVYHVCERGKRCLISRSTRTFKARQFDADYLPIFRRSQQKLVFFLFSDADRAIALHLTHLKEEVKFFFIECILSVYLTSPCKNIFFRCHW